MFNKLSEIKARREAGEKGFTLVELLVVVVIIAVLAAIAIPIFLNQKTKAQQSADQATVSAIANAINIGMSTGGYVYQAATASTSMTVEDGTGAQVTVPYGGAVIKVGGAVLPVLASKLALTGGSTFCTSLGGYSMQNGETGPDTTPAACP